MTERSVSFYSVTMNVAQTIETANDNSRQTWRKPFGLKFGKSRNRARKDQSGNPKASQSRPHNRFKQARDNIIRLHQKGANDTKALKTKKAPKKAERGTAFASPIVNIHRTPAPQPVWRPEEGFMGTTRIQSVSKQQSNNHVTGRNHQGSNKRGQNGSGGGDMLPPSLSGAHLGMIIVFFVSFFLALASIRYETSVELSYGLIGLTSIIALIGLKILSRENWRSRECLGLALWAGPLFLAATAFSLTVENMMVPTGLLGLIIGLSAGLRLPALAGLMALITTAALSSATVIGPIDMSVYQGCGLVATIFGYLGLAGHVRSRSILLATLICLSIWSTYWVSQTALSQHHLSLLIFMVSATFYKVGKTGLEDDTFGSMSLLITGWIVGTLAFLSLQWGYISPETHSMTVTGQNPYTSMPWFIGMACAMGSLVVLGVMQLTSNRYTVLSTLISFGILLTIPFIVLFPENFAGLNIISLSISLTLLAGLSLLMKSFSHNKDSYFYMALFTLAAQGFLLFQGNLLAPDDIANFFNGLNQAT